MDELNTRERNTLAKIEIYETFESYRALPAHTRVGVLRTLIERGLVDVRATAKGLAVLGREERKRYAAQVRHAHRFPGEPDRGWVTLFRGRNEYDTADQLWETLQRAGFRTNEIPDHIADLAKGHVISTEKGVEYRVLLRPREIDVETLSEA